MYTFYKINLQLPQFTLYLQTIRYIAYIHYIHIRTVYNDISDSSDRNIGQCYYVAYILLKGKTIEMYKCVCLTKIKCSFEYVV